MYGFWESGAAAENAKWLEHDIWWLMYLYHPYYTISKRLIKQNSCKQHYAVTTVLNMDSIHAMCKFVRTTSPAMRISPKT